MFLVKSLCFIHLCGSMRKCWLIGVFLLFTVGVWAQTAFYASLNTKSIPVNQNFQLSFTVENGTGKSLQLPNLNDFQVLSGPNTSQSMQWINGKTTQSVSYSFILRPKKEGTFKIGKAKIEVNGAEMESNELSISVTAPQQQVQRRSNSPFGFDPFSDPFGNDPFFGEAQQEEEPQQINTDINKQVRDNVFLRMVTDKNNVYEGEQITATLKLYYLLNFGNVQLSKAPKFDGFWSQEVAANPNQKPSVETVNGKEYYVLTIQQYNLFPQRSGKLSISPTELNMIVQVQTNSGRRDFFGRMFGQLQNVEYKAQSNAATINVKTLPEKNKPVNFSGAVGKFHFAATLSNKETKTSEAITYSVKVDGTGNLKTFDLPKPVFSDEFELYDPKTKEDIKGNTGFKQADYLVVPRHPGTYKIEPIEFVYFDPVAEKYVSLKSPEYTVSVSGEAMTAAAVENNPILPKAKIETLGNDIHYIKTNGELSPEKPFEYSPFYFGLLGAPFLLFVGLLAYKRKADKDRLDIVGTKLRKANRVARRRLANAEKHLNAHQHKLFYDEISRAVLGYVSDKLHIDVADLSKENIEEKLVHKKVNIELISQLKQLLSKCEFALYTNVQSDENMQQQYDTAVGLISSLENELKNA